MQAWAPGRGCLLTVQGAGSEGAMSVSDPGRREQGLAAGRSDLGGSSGVASVGSQESREGTAAAAAQTSEAAAHQTS